jgi:dTDP-4-dehydrorhamnose 3,5-epimerase
MKLTHTNLDGCCVITPARFGDARGFFSESWNKARMEASGLQYDFVQDNHSLSEQAGTVRGLHFQSPPHAQAKLVRCGRGSLLDVAVDIRKGSPTFGKWVAEELSFENGKQLLVPRGFVTLEPITEVVYKCDDYYAADCDGAVRFDDPDLSIDWGIETDSVVLSDKDAAALVMQDFDSPFIYKENC